MFPVNDPLTLDAIASLVAGAAAASCVRMIHRQDSRTSLEVRVVFVMSTLAALLLSRAVFWMSGLRFFGSLNFISATCAVLATFLYVEVLLRRHFHFFAKLAVLTGSLFFAVLSVIGFLPREAWALHAFTVYLVLISGYVATMVLLRDRSDLGLLENAMVDSIFVALGFSVPFFASDLMADLGVEIPRLGSVGALVIVLCIVRVSHKDDGKRVVFGEFVSLFAQAALILAAGIPLYKSLDSLFLVQAYSVLVSVLFAREMIRRARVLQARGRDQGFLKQLLRANTESLSIFLGSIRELSNTDSYQVVRKEDLNALYDPQSLKRAFVESETEILNLAQVRARAKRAQSHSKGAAAGAEDLFEQILDLLESRNMTHVCLLGAEPLSLLLANIPQIGSERLAFLEVGMVRKMAELIERGERHA